jgi:SAC3 family protein LENG8/THP3
MADAKVLWSPEVRQYVQRAFDPAAAVAGIDQAVMQLKLRSVITQAAEGGYMDSIDWSTYPLPQEILKAEREQATSSGVQNAARTNYHTPAPFPAQFDGTNSPGHGYPTKRKSDHEDNTDMLDTTPPWKKKKTKGVALEDRMAVRPKNHDKKQKKAPAFHIEVNADQLEKRKQRFGYVTPDPSPYLSSRDESPQPIAGPLVGTCQDLEKSYFRLTAPPHPSTVRPLHVLENSVEHIRTKWKQERNYNFACDQLKSIRQDLTVQHVKNELTVNVYETHARIALEMKDLGEYNQCQTQLRALYKMNLGGHPDEFTAYRILYIIYTCNRTDMNNLLADLTSADKRKGAVKHALDVRSALAAGNYHRFFRLYRDAPNMGTWLLDMIIQRERIAALATITRSSVPQPSSYRNSNLLTIHRYTPDVSVRFLAHELAFDFDDEDSSDPDEAPRKCLDFLCQHGGEPFVERKADGDVRFVARKAAGAFEGAKQAAFRAIDIKGQI